MKRVSEFCGGGGVLLVLDAIWGRFTLLTLLVLMTDRMMK